MKQNPFDDSIKQKAGSHKAAVPPDAWANIEKMKRRKRRPLAFWWLSGLLLFIGLGTFSYYITERPAAAAISGTQKINTAAPDPGTSLTNNGAVSNKNIASIKTADSTGSTTATQKTIAANRTANLTGKETSITTPEITATDNNTITGENNTVSAKNNLYRKPKNRTRGKLTVTQSPVLQTNDAETGDAAVAKIDRKKQLKKSKGKTRIRLTAGTEVDSNPVDNEPIPGTTSNNTVTIIATAAAHKDSVILAQPAAVTTRAQPVAASNTGEKQKKKSHAIKYAFFIDAGITGFLPVQQKDRLLSISRTTITPENKAAFVATEIHSTPQASFSYTLALRKRISNKIYIGTGIQYTIMKEKVWLSGTETNTHYALIKRLETGGAVPALINDTVATTTTGIRNITAINSYRFISIPIFMQYKLAVKSLWELDFTGGVYLNMSSYKNSIDGPLQPQYSTAAKTNEQQNKLTLDVYAGMRLSRFFGKKYQLYIEPALQYNLIKYDMQNMINNKYIHKAGISFGLSYTIGK